MFVWPLSNNINPRVHAVIVAREKDVSDEMKRHYGGNNRGSLMYYVDQFVNGLLTRWALAGLLSGFERYLNNLRDSAVKPNDKDKTLHLLENLASHITRSVDISAVSVELKNFLITHKFQPQLTGDRATEESAQRHERVEEPDQRVGSGG